MGKFNAPWSIIEHEESFEIVSASGQSLAYLYFEDREGVSALSPRLKRDEARRLAANIVKLPSLLRS